MKDTLNALYVSNTPVAHHHLPLSPKGKRLDVVHWCSPCKISPVLGKELADQRRPLRVLKNLLCAALRGGLLGGWAIHYRAMPHLTSLHMQGVIDAHTPQTHTQTSVWYTHTSTHPTAHTPLHTIGKYPCQATWRGGWGCTVP